MLENKQYGIEGALIHIGYVVASITALPSRVSEKLRQPPVNIGWAQILKVSEKVFNPDKPPLLKPSDKMIANVWDI